MTILCHICDQVESVFEQMDLPIAILNILHNQFYFFIRNLLFLRISFALSLLKY